MKNRIIGYLILLFITVGCDPNRIYEENIDLDEAIWKLEDSKKFEFRIEDVSSSYNLYFNIRNTLTYPFQNIYIRYNLRDSTNKVLQSELKEYHLFDVKTGEPQGDGLGDLFDNRFVLSEGQKFDYSGNYSVDLQQFMRLDSLPMVVSVGLRVTINED